MVVVALVVVVVAAPWPPFAPLPDEPKRSDDVEQAPAKAAAALAARSSPTVASDFMCCAERITLPNGRPAETQLACGTLIPRLTPEPYTIHIARPHAAACRSAQAEVAQSARAGVSYAPGRGFDSLLRHHFVVLFLSDLVS